MIRRFRRLHRFWDGQALRFRPRRQTTPLSIDGIFRYARKKKARKHDSINDSWASDRPSFRVSRGSLTATGDTKRPTLAYVPAAPMVLLINPPDSRAGD
jgi:hypothetical protein